jgi:hypothetical protein
LWDYYLIGDYLMARGGYRPGAGRPKGAKGGSKTKKQPIKTPQDAVLNDPKTPEDVKEEVKSGKKDPLEYMLDVMNDASAEVERRDKMAFWALPFCYAKPAEKGKKDDKSERAKVAGAGKFAPSAPPKLAAFNGGKK